MQVMEPREVLDKLAHYPLRVFEEGDVVLSEGSKTGRLLFLKHGAVDVVVDDVEVAQITEPGAVFGDVALLIDEAHRADVRAAQPSSFLVIDKGEDLLESEPAVLLYVAKVLARRLDTVNHLLSEGKSRSEEEEARTTLIGEMFQRIGRALQIRVPRGP
ncbi:MAG: cyclic nucleotide-binding domain-containing protein [Pseudomonadota bacterium]